MSRRYSYTATIKTGGGYDENGDPVIGGSTKSFKCDYQPTVKETKITVNAAIVPISFTLYVPPYSKEVFAIGNEVTCNGSKGTISLVNKTSLNIKIWVK